MEFRDTKSIYLQIADQFFDNILIEKWKPDDRIPSVREMAEETGVNPNTVMRTFTYLQQMNIIYNKRGIGYFVSPDAYQKTLELKQNEFMKEDLPRLARTMELLKISVDDLKKMFNQIKQSNNEN